MTHARILITPGEPAGIGPDVLIEAAQHDLPANIIAVTDPAVLSDRARVLGLPLEIIECDLTNSDRLPHEACQLHVHPASFTEKVIPGLLSTANARTVMVSLQLAAKACLNFQADALVTGPVHKGIINEAGIPFTGHTEFLANISGAAQTVMLFIVDDIKAALVTTHLPLKDVPAAVTPEKLTSVINIMRHDLQKYFGILDPRILVAGLNPHAGENGHMGREEITIIEPALAALKQKGVKVIGPLPADTLFTPAVQKTGDAILGMYHDQILTAIKQLGFDRAVNMTLGLPFIRTSVDHGTALNIAGKGIANPNSLMAAIKLAISIQPSSNG